MRKSDGKERIFPPELVRKLLRYDPRTGHIFYRERDPKDHPETKEWAIRQFNRQYAGQKAGSVCSQGYIQVALTVGGVRRNFKGHRLAWVLHHGEWPQKQIDHINGKRDDNRIENLRDVSHFENHRNRKRHSKNKSGHWGVRWHNGAWEAKFRSYGKNHYCGRFPTKDEAAKAVRAKADELGTYTKRHGVAE